MDLTAGCQLLSFLDAYSGYNQIPMTEEDEEKTSFITELGLLCYRVMPFGFKNAGATYQRLMTHIFSAQIGKNMEVYIDDMLVKSINWAGHVNDIKETFDTLRKFKMMLNPDKCVFGIEAGKFLGYLVSQRGIEICPEYIKAIQEMPTPSSKKEVQRLTGKLAAVSRFLSRSADRSALFFKTLKGKNVFHWGKDCDSKRKECFSLGDIAITPSSN